MGPAAARRERDRRMVLVAVEDMTQFASVCDTRSRIVVAAIGEEIKPGV